MMTTYTGLHLYKSISKLREKPVERPKYDFNYDYTTLKQEQTKLEREIKQLENELRSEKNEFAAHYDDLVCEQQEIVSMKDEEMATLTTEIKKIESEINELENWTCATEKLEKMLSALTDQTETIKKQEQLFIEEIGRYTRAITELGAHTATTGDELLLNTTSRLPKFRDPNHKDAALLASSLYSLRLVLVKRYAESLSSCSGCSVQ